MSDVSWGDMDGFVDRTSADRRSLHQALIEISSSSGGFFSAEWPSMESAAGVWQPPVFTDAYLLSRGAEWFLSAHPPLGSATDRAAKPASEMPHACPPRPDAFCARVVERSPPHQIGSRLTRLPPSLSMYRSAGRDEPRYLERISGAEFAHRSRL